MANAENSGFKGLLFGAVVAIGTAGSVELVIDGIDDPPTYVLPFPQHYMDYSSWSTTPNQREEIKAYRDDNTRNLTRVTAEGRKTAISFKLRDGLHLEDKQIVQAFFTSHESNQAERKIQIAFWNDESNEYKTGYFYRPNTQFPIKKITNNDIIYGSVQIDLVEY